MSMLLNSLRSVSGVEINASLARVFLRWWRKERFSVVSLLEKLNEFAESESKRDSQ
ncbi:MAG: hypothetical protein QXL29_07815 [Zestosphaera sp.]